MDASTAGEELAGVDSDDRATGVGVGEDAASAGVGLFLAEAAGEEVPEGLKKAQASEMIETLQAKTGRGQSAQKSADNE